MTTRPTAAKIEWTVAGWPYFPTHRTMAQVMADEANTYDRTRYERERRSVRTLVEP